MLGLMAPAHSTSEQPLILVTCGDPAGIGPEVVARAWQRPAVHEQARLRVMADATLLAAVLGRRASLEPIRIVTVAIDDPRPSRPDELLVVEPAGRRILPAAIRDATITAAGGAAAAEAVQQAAAAVLAGSAAAVVTGPLHKEALHAAGYDAPGHTELLARACGLPDAAASMMLWLPGTANRSPLGVVHATLHESLRTAIARLSTETIFTAGLRLHAGLSRLRGERPGIAVAALNPHGGEGGLFGDEEARIIAPAVEQLARAGVAVTGPLPADTLFARALRGEFAGVVALYHDQGHIPVKLLGMHEAVNITLGLPLVRTSVAHGTAFDIVGTGRADPASMLAAIDAATRLVAHRTASDFPTTPGSSTPGPFPPQE
jgi:4-hydroxythreonine-4-phosphate dehydrogenase